MYNSRCDRKEGVSHYVTRLPNRKRSKIRLLNDRHFIHAAAPWRAVYRHAQDLNIFRAAPIMQFVQNDD